MVSMSPRKAAPSHISIPARILSLTRSRGGSVDSSDSNPCTPSPRTPLPYSCEYISGALRLDSPLMTPTEMHAPPMLASSSSSSMTTATGKSKRARDEDEEKKEDDWSAEDLELVRATVLHPFRPLSSPYPPGELAPPHILDEITTQIVNCSRDQRLISSKARRALAKSKIPSPVSSSFLTDRIDSASSSASASPTSSASSGSLTPRASAQADSGKWRHSWAATRRRVYLASVEATREAHGLGARDAKAKSTGDDAEEGERERPRPTLRRMDSMDFLDQAAQEDEEAGQSQVGRAMRLSTTLQNTTKFVPSPMLLRSASVGSGMNKLAPSSSTSLLAPDIDQPSPMRPASPARASTGSILPSGHAPMLTLTPASPQKPQKYKATNGNKSAQQVPSIRKNRQSRPSLLQRGRSFTASDLGSVNGDASDDEVEGDGKQVQGKSRSSPSSPRVTTFGMGLTSLTALSTGAAVLESRRSSTESLGGPAPMFLDSGFMCESPPLLSGAGVDKPLPIGLGMPGSGVAVDQSHLTSPPSPRTRRRSQALGNELVAPPALAAPATVRPSPKKEIKQDGWSDTDEDADDDFAHTRKRAMKRQRSNGALNADYQAQKAQSKGAGIGRSGSMAMLKQAAALDGADKLGLASPFDEKAGFLL